jgi:hypothetical protein
VEDGGQYGEFGPSNCLIEIFDARDLLAANQLWSQLGFIVEGSMSPGDHIVDRADEKHSAYSAVKTPCGGQVLA